MGMDMLRKLQARFPRVLPALTVALLGGTFAFAVHERLTQSCCHEGASCCYPGSPCCNGAHKVAAK